MTECSVKKEELLIYTIAELLAGLNHVAVGASSPIPGAAALLARELSGGTLRVSMLGSREFSPFTDGGRELFDCAAQGRIDAFFLSGVQIDAEANINLLGLGTYPQLRKRFSGSFGSAYLYHLIPKIVLFTWAHNPNVLVPRVDFVSAAGQSAADVYRPGGPAHLITNRCLFDYDRDGGRFVLTRVHPDNSVDDIRRETGFSFDEHATLSCTPTPDKETLDVIRTTIAPQLAETYPEFARRVFGR